MVARILQIVFEKNKSMARFPSFTTVFVCFFLLAFLLTMREKNTVEWENKAKHQYIKITIQ